MSKHILGGSMRSIRKRLLFPAMLIFFVLIALVIFVGVRIYDHFYGMHRVSAWEYTPEIAENEYNIVYNAEYYGKAVVFGEDLYLNLEFINDTWGHELFFYAEDVNRVYYTSQTTMLEYSVGNGDFIVVEGVVYMKAAFATEALGVQYYVNDIDRLVMVRRVSGNVANVERFRSYLRLSPDLNDHQYTVELDRNEQVEVYGEEVNGFYYVVSQSGYMGYILADRLTIHEETLSAKEMDIYIQDSDALFSHRISMAFVQLGDDGGLDDLGAVSDDLEYEVDRTYYYLNCLAPTMFSLTEDGALKSTLSPQFVKWAHNEFYDVWVVFTNNFDDDLTYETLSNTRKRQALSQKIYEELERCGADGINIDFENLSERTYPYFIQFLRELCMTVRVHWYTVSICDMVPSEWTDYYRRDLYDDLCDYVVVMAYDEYWGGSEVAGPVSSQNFTMNAIHNELKYFDKGKLVLGIPWYCRIWYGEDYELKDSIACSLEYAQMIVEDYDLDKSFDSTTGMNYYDGYDDEGTRVRIWMEDDVSVRWRLSMAFDTDLAGIAAWRLGLQNWIVWEPYEDLLIGNNF